MNLDVLTKDMVNMATTQMASFIKPQDRYEIGNDVGLFLEELERFFDLLGIKEEMQCTFVRAFLSVDAVRKYEADKSEMNFKENLRKLFGKKSTIGEALTEAIHAEKTTIRSKNFPEKSID